MPEKRAAKTAVQLNRGALEVGAFLLSTRWQMHLDRILAVWRFLLFGRRGKRTFIGKQDTNHHKWDSVSAPRHSKNKEKWNSTHALLCNGWNASLLKLLTHWSLELKQNDLLYREQHLSPCLTSAEEDKGDGLAMGYFRVNGLLREEQTTLGDLRAFTLTAIMQLEILHFHETWRFLRRMSNDITDVQDKYTTPRRHNYNYVGYMFGYLSMPYMYAKVCSYMCSTVIIWGMTVRLSVCLHIWQNDNKAHLTWLYFS